MDGKFFFRIRYGIKNSRNRTNSKVFVTRIGRFDLLTLRNGHLNVKYELSVVVSILTEFWTMKVIIANQKSCPLL